MIHTELARAKVNLCLHVVGQRADGFHDLQSLVVFPDIADEIALRTDDKLSLSITGPFSEGLSPTDNLILAAAQMMHLDGAHVQLHKNLPVAAGIGGGSADAAAAIRAIARLNQTAIPSNAELMSLGADVPVCIAQEPAMMTGAGESVTAIALPSCGIVLVNCLQPVGTAEVFAALSNKYNAPMDPIPDSDEFDEWVEFLSRQRNDLEQAAIDICPAISDVLSFCRQTDTCRIVRMSGSGATCFALFETRDLADQAAAHWRLAHPEWWIASGQI